MHARAWTEYIKVCIKVNQNILERRKIVPKHMKMYTTE